MQEENLQEYEKNSFEMTPEIQEHYDKVREIISQEEFFERMEKFRQQESANPFLNDSGLAEMVVGELIDEEVEVISEKPEFAVDTIDKLEKGSRGVTRSTSLQELSEFLPSEVMKRMEKKETLFRLRTWTSRKAIQVLKLI